MMNSGIYQIPVEINEQTVDSVNILTVERGLIRFLEGLRILPEYEQIRYGILEPDEVGVALSLSDSSLCGNSHLRLEFTLWGRSVHHDDFRSRFGKFPRKLPKHGRLISLEGGSRIAFTRLESPLGVVFEPEYLFGIRVLNGILFLEIELDLQESVFHIDDAPTLDMLVMEERKLPLLALERSAAEYLRQKLKAPLEVELDSLSPLRRRGGAELRLRISSDTIHPEELAARFPILLPEFPDPQNAPGAILPGPVMEDYLTLFCIY